MKLMIVGSGEQHAIEAHYVKYLKKEGLDVHLFPAQSIFYRYYNESTFNKFIFKAGLSPIYTMIGNQLLEEVNRNKPDIVWVIKGMEIQAAYLKKIRQLGIKLVNYNPDNPFLFSGIGSGNVNITEGIPLYDLHFTYDHFIANKILAQYGIPVSILPFGYDIHEDWYNECIQEKEVSKVCFIGNPDPARVTLLNEITYKVPVVVFGHNWSKFILNKNMEVHQPVYDKEFWKVLYRYRVQLNMMRPHNPNSHNMRSFEIPAIGGIGLYPDTPDHRNFFENGKEVFLYSNESDCITQAEKILNMDKLQQLQIRTNARKRSASSGYSYCCRAAFVAAEMIKLLS